MSLTARFALLTMLCCFAVQGKQFAKISLDSSLAALKVYAVCWASSSEVLAAGNDNSASYVWRSADHGLSWSKVLTVSSRTINGLASKTISTGTTYHIAVDQSRSAYVSDGAASSWSAVNTGTGSSAAMYGATIGANGNAFLSGSFNYVLKSGHTSSYTSWSTLTPLSTALPFGFTWFDIHTLDGVTVLLVGNAGRIYYSTDAGVSWLPGSSGTSAAINSVCQASSAVAMAAGTGYLAKTTDGGATWTNITAFDSTYSTNFHTMSMVSAAEAYVAASTVSLGLIYSTTDGGTTWSILASTDVQLYSLSMFSSAYGVAGAASGVGVLALVSGTMTSCCSFDRFTC